MAQYVVKKGDSLYTIAQRVLGDGNRWKELGYTGDPKKLQVGTVINYGGSSGSTNQPPASSAPASSPLDAYTKLIQQWYSTKPATPPVFQYTPEQQASDTSSVQQEYRPFYQEKIDVSNQDYGRTLQNARQSFSRRNLWGAASTPTMVYAAGAQGSSQGPVSGIRQQGENLIEQQRNQAQTAYERAYQQAVAQGVQGRQAQSYDVFQKTILDPYKQAYQDWQNQLAVLQAQSKLY